MTATMSTMETKYKCNLDYEEDSILLKSHFLNKSFQILTEYESYYMIAIVQNM